MSKKGSICHKKKLFSAGPHSTGIFLKFDLSDLLTRTFLFILVLVLLFVCLFVVVVFLFTRWSVWVPASCRTALAISSKKVALSWIPDRLKKVTETGLFLLTLSGPGRKVFYLLSASQVQVLKLARQQLRKETGGRGQGLEVEPARSEGNGISSVRWRLRVEYLMPVRGASSKFIFCHDQGFESRTRLTFFALLR